MEDNPSEANLPLSRIRTIMKSSPESMNLGQDAVFCMTKAAELFVQMLATNALETRYDRTGDRNGKKVDYQDLAEFVQANNDTLEYLEEIVPKKLRVKDCLKLITDATAEELSRSQNSQ